MPAYSVTRSFVARSYGGVFSTIAGLFISWAEQYEGSAKTIVAGTLVTTSDPWILTVEAHYTTEDGTEVTEFWNIYLAFTAMDPAPVSVAYGAAFAAATSPPCFPRVVIDGSSPGFEFFTPSELAAAWAEAFYQTWINLLNVVSTGAVTSLSTAAHDLGVSAVNTHEYVKVLVGSLGPTLFAVSWSMLLMNESQSGPMFERVEDATLLSQDLITKDASGLVGVVGELRIANQMDRDISINRGASIFSVRGGVISE